MIGSGTFNLFGLQCEKRAGYPRIRGADMAHEQEERAYLDFVAFFLEFSGSNEIEYLG